MTIANPPAAMGQPRQSTPNISEGEGTNRHPHGTLKGAAPGNAI
jgi:hypothetical protein